MNYKKICKDCSMLVEINHEWFCDEIGLNCKDIDSCIFGLPIEDQNKEFKQPFNIGAVKNQLLEEFQILGMNRNNKELRKVLEDAFDIATRSIDYVWNYKQKELKE